ncbi:MAG: alanine racemase [Actinomycetes bacterium]
MTFSLYVDEERWRRHQRSVLDASPGLVPVIKGTGYGFGNSRLAAEAARLGSDIVAVGTVNEVDQVRAEFGGDVLVLTPSYDAPELVPPAGTVQTVAHLERLRSLRGGERVVLECLTSMHRHGLPPADLAEVPALLDGVRLEGFAFHLPMDRHGGYEPATEVADWLRRLQQTGLPTDVAWVSHLTATDLAQLQAAFPSTRFRPRVGTALWLGDRGAFGAKGTVLDVHRLAAGTHYGYRRRRVHRDSWLLVVSGGTSHGVALEAPRTVRGPVGRIKELAFGSLAAANRTLSPFTWAGRQRWFAEPPHMHVSLVLLPASVTPPAIGDELACEVRMTTLHADRVTPSPAAAS